MRKLFLIMLVSIFTAVNAYEDKKLNIQVNQLLSKYCYDCHDEDIQKGDIRLDNLAELNAAARFEMLNRIEEQVYLSLMPPKKKKQPDQSDKASILNWISSSYHQMKVKSEFREKLHEPAYGNYVDHNKLFSGEITEKAYSPARKWLISPYIFDSKINSIMGRLKKDSGIMNPIHLPDISGVRDYDNKLAGGDHFITMMSNAKIIAYNQLGVLTPEKVKQYKEYKERLLRSIAEYEKRNAKPGTVSYKRLKGFKKNLINLERIYKEAKRGKQNLPIPFKQIMNKKSFPSDSEMKHAINQQFLIIYDRMPNELEMNGCFNVLKKSIEKLGNTDGLLKMMTAVIMQSDFLYRSELGEGPVDEFGRKQLSPREASYAIAYALTERGPDKRLKIAAGSGNLNTKADYKREIERLLAVKSIRVPIDNRLNTNRTGSYVTSQPAKLRFFREFFAYSKAYQIFKDNKRFEDALYKRNTHDFAIRLTINEADLFVDKILEEDKDVFNQLLTSDKFFLYHNGNNTKASLMLAKRKQLIAEMREAYKTMKPIKFWEKYNVDLDVQYEVDSRKGIPKGEDIQKIKAAMKDQSKGTGFNPMIYPMDFNRNSILPNRNGMLAKNRTNMFNIDHNTWSYVAEQPIKIPKRMGILTHPAWLTAQSLNVSTDPVKRGKWIREKLLAGFIPDVPITVDAAIPEDHNKTLRQRLHEKTKHSACWKCHESMNPLGYAFEMYDDFGRFRSKEELEYPEHIIKEAPDTGRYTRNTYKTVPLDTTGHLSGTGDPKLDGDVKDAIDLIWRLAKSDRVRQSIIRHAFRYFMGRNEMLSDSQTLIAADKAYLESGGSFNAVIISLLTSDSFMYRK